MVKYVHTGQGTYLHNKLSSVSALWEDKMQWDTETVQSMHSKHPPNTLTHTHAQTHTRTVMVELCPAASSPTAQT